MPQITVTLDEMTYMDLIHNLPKGMKSAFVNRAVARALNEVCAGYGGAMHAYARKGEVAARKKVDLERAYRDQHQQSLKKWDKLDGGEEE